MKVAVHQPNYVPWLGYFSKIAQSHIFVFYDDVQFEKGGYTNRVRIQGCEHHRWLTQPVQKRGILSKTIRDVLLSEDDWTGRHRSVLFNEYRKAEYFHDLEPMLTELYSFEASNLSEWNITAIRYLCGRLGLGDKTLVCSSRLSYDRTGNASEKLGSICRELGGDCYLSGSGGASYHDEDLFVANGISVEYSTFSKRNASPQLDLSVLHAISVRGVDAVRETLAAERTNGLGAASQREAKVSE